MSEIAKPVVPNLQTSEEQTKIGIRISIISKDGVHFMKPWQFPFHLKVTQTESHRAMRKR